MSPPVARLQTSSFVKAYANATPDNEASDFPDMRRLRRDLASASSVATGFRSNRRFPFLPAAAPADPRHLQVHRAVAKWDVPYIPTDDAVVAAMLRFGGITEKDKVYDLGCGDGRIVIAAARQCGVRCIGADIDSLRIEESRDNARRASVADRVQFDCRSFFEVDLHVASAVMLYLLPAINVKLLPKLRGNAQVPGYTPRINPLRHEWE